MVNGTAAPHLAVESADMPRFGTPGLKNKACTYRKCISISLSQQLAYNECDSGNYISLISNVNARNLRPQILEGKKLQAGKKDDVDLVPVLVCYSYN